MGRRSDAEAQIGDLALRRDSRIAIGDTLREALTTVFGAAPETLEEGPAPSSCLGSRGVVGSWKRREDEALLSAQ